jgi:hypothetical protein
MQMMLYGAEGHFGAPKQTGGPPELVDFFTD